MASHSLDPETLVPSVDTLMLLLLQHSKDLPELQDLHRLPQHSEDLPGSLQHEEELLHHHAQPPPLPTPTTESTGVQVTVNSSLEAKPNNDESLVHKASHPTKIHIMHKHSTNLPDSLNNTKSKDSTALDTDNKHSHTDNVNHKPSPAENNENKGPRNTAAHKHDSAFDKPKFAPIINKLPDTAPDNPDNLSGNELLTNHPFRKPSKSVGPVESAPNDDLEKKPHTSSTLHEVKDKEPSPLLAKELPDNTDDSSTEPRHTISTILELTDLKDAKPAAYLEITDPDESSLDDLKPAQPEPTDLKEEKAATIKKKSSLDEPNTHPPAPNMKNSLKVLDKEKHDKPGNLTEDNPQDEAETPYPTEAKEPDHNPTKSTDPPDKDNESTPNPPETNKSDDPTDPPNGNETPTQNLPNKPELFGKDDHNSSHLPKTNESAVPMDTLTKDETPPKKPPDYLEPSEEKNDDPSDMNEEFPTPPETDDLAAPD